MRSLSFALFALAFLWPGANALAQSTPAENYDRYCALCHGADRAGYENDQAPSLITETLYAVGPMVPYMAISYGRPGTPMGPYLDEVGGPMSDNDLRALTMWLAQQAGHPPSQPGQDTLTPIRGDAQLGSQLYGEHCASCHGEQGEGGEGTALGNPTMLATSPDLFLKAAISGGRSGTSMKAYGETLSEAEIDGIVTFLRSRAQGWDVEEMQFEEPPSLENIVLNPDGEAPNFELSDGRYVSASALNAAMDAGKRMILIDTRVPYFWAMAHIEGSIPVPYYSSREEIINALPKDDTWIVAYCECPRAAADSTVNSLRLMGYENTAVLYEGYAGWAALGYPIRAGQVDPERVSAQHEGHAH